MAVYPRKSTFVILVVCILLVGGTSFYVRGDIFGFELWFLKREAPSPVTTSISIAKQEPIATTGDWRKQFLDEKSPSSSLKGPASAETSQAQEEKLTATDLLGRAFLTKFGELEQSGLSADEKSVESVMNQVSSDIIASLPQPKTYSASDIQTIASSVNSLAAYAKSISVVFARYTPSQSEAAIANKALTEENMSLLEGIDPIIASYKALLDELRAIPAPTPLAQHHVGLLNGVSLAIYNAEAIRNMEADPVRGLAGVSLGVAAMQNIANILYSVNDYLVAAGVNARS